MTTTPQPYKKAVKRNARRKEVRDIKALYLLAAISRNDD